MKILIAVNITFLFVFVLTGLITKHWKNAVSSTRFFLYIDFIIIFTLFIAKFLAE